MLRTHHGTHTRSARGIFKPADDGSEPYPILSRGANTDHLQSRVPQFSSNRILGGIGWLTPQISGVPYLYPIIIHQNIHGFFGATPDNDLVITCVLDLGSEGGPRVRISKEPCQWGPRTDGKSRTTR